MAKLYTMQNRLEVTSSLNCSVNKTIFTLFIALLYMTQNSDATIQSRIVPTTKPHGYFGHMTLHL